MKQWEIAYNVKIMCCWYQAGFNHRDYVYSKPYIEYSFVESRYFVVNGEPVTDSGWDPSPSVHFRHRGQANVGWADGHVSFEKMGKYDGINDDETRPTDMDLGWFAPMDNTSFDLK